MHLQEMASQGESIRMMVTGRIYQGKSKLVNSLFGTKVAKERSGPHSVTHDIKSHTKVVRGVQVTLIDTPGFSHPRIPDRHILSEMDKQEHIDLILFCVRIDAALEKANYRIMRNLTRLFGKPIWEYTVFVLTFANKVNPDTFAQTIAVWEKELHEKVHTEGGVQADIARQIPVVVAGNEEESLPGYKSWFDLFWVTAFDRTKDKPAYLRSMWELDSFSNLLFSESGESSSSISSSRCINDVASSLGHSQILAHSCFSPQLQGNEAINDEHECICHKLIRWIRRKK